MPPPPRKLHELRPVRKANSAYVFYRRKWWPLGPWDPRRDQPSDEAEEKLAGLKALWRVDPAAGSVRADDPLLITLWNDWRSSPHAPADRRDEFARVEASLFGSTESPGPHLATRVSEFGSPELLAWQDWLCSLKRGDGQSRFGRYSVRRYISLVRQCFKWGVAAGRVDATHAAGLSAVPAPPDGAVREPVERCGVSEEDFLAAVSRVKSRAGALLGILWLTGARPSEVNTLTPAEIIRAGEVRPRKGPPVKLVGLWAVVREKHKTRRKVKVERVIFFGPKAQAILTPLISGCDPNRPIFATARGKAYTSKQVRDYLKRACERASIEVVTPYQLRHAAAELVQAAFSAEIPGAGWLAAQAFLGHKVKGVTTGYAGSDLTTAAAVAAKVG